VSTSAWRQTFEDLADCPTFVAQEVRIGWKNQRNVNDHEKNQRSESDRARNHENENENGHRLNGCGRGDQNSHRVSGHATNRENGLGEIFVWERRDEEVRQEDLRGCFHREGSSRSRPETIAIAETAFEIEIEIEKKRKTWKEWVL
jgi:hypothetical protein